MCPKFKLKEGVLGEKGEKSFIGHFLMASPRLPMLTAARVHMQLPNLTTSTTHEKRGRDSWGLWKAIPK